MKFGVEPPFYVLPSIETILRRGGRNPDPHGTQSHPFSGWRPPPPLPTKTSPLLMDAKNSQVLIYTEINAKNWDKLNPHWGVVFQGGKLSHKAIFSAYCTPEEFHAALLQIGANSGNNLIQDQTGVVVQGDELSVSVLRPGLNKSLSLRDVLFDQTGKGFRIRFGGNLERATKEKTGCITCLESCPVGITSNAAYPTIGSWKRFFYPNSLFKGKTGTLPAQKGAPVILIYELINSKNIKLSMEE
jgi:hypothetical protein